jgi:hypothetical protein
MNASLRAAAFHRMQQLMSTSPVPSISTELLTTADGELNRELNSFLFDPPSDPTLLKGKRVAICCTNGVEEVEMPTAGSRNMGQPCMWSRHASASSTPPWACAFRRNAPPMCWPSA